MAMCLPTMPINSPHNYYNTLLASCSRILLPNQTQNRQISNLIFYLPLKSIHTFSFTTQLTTTKRHKICWAHAHAHARIHTHNTSEPLKISKIISLTLIYCACAYFEHAIKRKLNTPTSSA